MAHTHEVKVHCSFCISCRAYVRANWVTQNKKEMERERHRYWKETGNLPYGMTSNESFSSPRWSYHFCTKCAIKQDIKGGINYGDIKYRYSRLLEGPFGDDTLSST